MNSDITFNKHHGNSASVAAYSKGKDRHAIAREMIAAMIESSSGGMTSKEIAERTGWALHTFSGRLTELKAMGRIRGKGECRMGAEVLEAVYSDKAEQGEMFQEVE